MHKSESVALKAAFLVWDVASVAVGVLSFGTATAAMMGATAGTKVAGAAYLPSA
jgi:hypothetical protein